MIHSDCKPSSDSNRTSSWEIAIVSKGAEFKGVVEEGIRASSRSFSGGCPGWLRLWFQIRVSLRKRSKHTVVTQTDEVSASNSKTRPNK